ncbi:MAG: 23S rRNA (adenine(2503)-C(2))-methyltransferase RlmN [Candidatus Omnitrophica bacterium]|nr:23S rRNA (adenine(2503)-C(2))-methyltransferase RlmN [Candidatus Omnitrophota bacterium]MCG2703443.1 23S rRNA (adenine(2503)-C(2))-methyltransferase RlmN [Candidatus Omnitrophota bacterium]
MDKKIVVAGMLLPELSEVITKMGEPGFRAKQIMEWVFKKNTLSFERMSNLSAALRQSLDASMQVVSLRESRSVVSADKTVKYLFQTRDNNVIESVFLPESKRATLCLSTQVGCAFGCTFCASGANGLARDLSADEIVSQVLLIKNANPDTPLTNIVIMGMGEPLANYEQTLKAVRIMNSPDCIGIAARKITISTCGLPKEIMRLVKEGIQVELSVSLHAADDELRTSLMPVNKKYPLFELMNTAKEYIRQTNRIITFEYVLIKGVNDRKEDAQRLAALLSRIKCKVNFITLNEL